MNFFPVSDSTLSPAHIAIFVKDKYKLNGALTARIVKTGINHTYLISADAQQYIFRVYSLQWRTEKEIAAEIKLLNLFHENDIPVSYPIADAGFEYIQRLAAPEGLRFAVMFSFAKGEKMLNMPAASHYEAGLIMAKMHRLAHNRQLERINYTPAVLLGYSFEQLKQFLPAGTDEMIYMKSLQKYLYDAFAAVQANKLRKGIVHLDIWFDNMSIDKDNGITIFDFDFCGNGWMVLDIAYYNLQLFSTEKEEDEYNTKKESFFKGYESVTVISKEEKKIIPAAAASLYFFYLGVQCNRYDNWSNNFLNEIYLKRFINLLVKKWVNFHKLKVE